MTSARIIAIEYHLPDQEFTNAQLEQLFPDLPAAKTFAKTGIECRHIAAPDECASDLAAKAAEKLLATGVCQRADIDALLLCTQSPDYLLPSSACLLQERLGLPTHVAAFDFNLGCSGFVYGLGIAKGLIETGQAKNVLLLTADTYSKHLDANDRSVRTLFGDAAAATLISAAELPSPAIGPFVYGTDGRGAGHLIVKNSAMRRDEAAAPKGTLHMNGPEIFTFTLKAVPTCVAALCAKAGITMDDVDLFVFHQANAYMLEHLRDKMDIPPEKFALCVKDCGNTVGATIPIALHEAVKNGSLKPGMNVMLVGFGVGLSWAATVVRWEGGDAGA